MEHNHAESSGKILLMTDSASDISDSDLKTGGIVMLPIPVAIDGEGYLERVDFTTEQFYQRLEQAKELPVTSHIPAHVYENAYEDAYTQGYTDIINTTITSKGSNMFQAAVAAKKQFFEAHPDAADRLRIHVIDSGSYTLGYGFPIVQASRMIAQGKDVQDILSYLEDFYDHYEIVFAPFSLKYAKKSGRIPAAAAFVGDMLGLRPVISIIDGVTTVAGKIRGEKNLPAAIADYAYSRAADHGAPTAVVYGSVPQAREQMADAIRSRFGKAPSAFYQAGASIVINAGPGVAGMIVRGEKRTDTRAREQDFLV